MYQLALKGQKQKFVDSRLTDAFSTHHLIYLKIPWLTGTLVKQLGNHPIS